MGLWMKSNYLCIAALAIILAGLFFNLPCYAESQTAVEKKFNTFAGNWIFRIETAYLYTRKNPKIEFSNGQYRASFHQVAPDTIQTDVKPAAGSSSIFTGVLQYNEYLFQSKGATRDQALAGPFEPISLKKMTEIFLYDNGSWMP
jgi:hypothetical protein